MTVMLPAVQLFKFDSTLALVFIILTIHEFHRDASLETKLQGRCRHWQREWN